MDFPIAVLNICMNLLSSLLGYVGKIIFNSTGLKTIIKLIEVYLAGVNFNKHMKYFRVFSDF